MKYDFLSGCSQCLHLTKGKFSVCRKKRLTRTACTRNNKSEFKKKKKKSCCCRLVVSVVFSFDSRVQFWLPDREYEGHRRRAGSHHTNRRVGFGSVCRSVRRSVCLSVASRKPRDRETLGRPSICTREDLPPPARWETSAVRSAL